MALSVVKTPNGYIVNDETLTASFTNDSSVVTQVAHGLSTGNIIYIKTGQAIGFWYVTSLTADTFNIREYNGSTVYTFIGSGSFTYAVATINCFYVSAHLPIVFKLKSTLWPTNSVDTVRTVSSYSNDNGYVKITASGVISSDITELSFVKITFTGGTTGIYQVLSWYSTSVVTLNLPYVGGLTFVSVQFYYNNYRARIKVYAGLDPTHTFANAKPYELITEQSVIPDTNGVIEINISDFVKQKIDILANDLESGILPMNIDAFTNFYISYAESYDYSVGGYTLLDYIGSYTDSIKTVYAVNSKLPFKNIYSGLMSEYIYSGFAVQRKFLTPSLYPTIFGSNYFDLSWIQNNGLVTRIKIERYQSGSIIDSSFTTFDNTTYQYGVIRTQISTVGAEDRIDVTLFANSTQVSEVKTITINNDCSPNHVYLTWLNYTGGFDYWDFKGNSDFAVNIEQAKTVERNIYSNWPNSYGKGAEEITTQTTRSSRQFFTIRAENITEDQINDLFRIKSSPLVQMFIGDGNFKKTVIVDNSSFTYLRQGEKLFNLTFNISMTDQLPSQSL